MSIWVRQMESSEEIARTIYSIPYWRQRIKVGEGVVTPGRSTPDKWERFDLADVSEKRVLDVGAWDGLHAFLAEEHGAIEVVAMDVYEQRGDYGGWWESIRDGVGDAGIQTAKELRSSDVEIWDRSVYDLSPSSEDAFDIVLFPAVLYHLKKPMQAFEALSAVTKETLVVETRVAPRGDNMALDGGETPPWWVPDLPTLRKMLQTTGFTDIEVVSRDFLPFDDRPVAIPPNAEVTRAENSFITEEWKRGRLLADGSDVPLPEHDEHYYVEFSTDSGPLQGWIDRTEIETGYRGVVRARGFSGIAKRLTRNAIRLGYFGSLGQRLAGINTWVVVHAYK